MVLVRIMHAQHVMTAQHEVAKLATPHMSPEHALSARQGQLWAALAVPAALFASTWADDLILCETNTNSYLFGLGLAGGLTTFDNPVKGAPEKKKEKEEKRPGLYPPQTRCVDWVLNALDVRPRIEELACSFPLSYRAHQRLTRHNVMQACCSGRS